MVTEEYTQLLEERELEPVPLHQLMRDQGYNIFLGAFAALASYALFHIVTVFPLSWIVLSNTQTVDEVLSVQIVGGALAVVGMLASGRIADKIGRRRTLGALAVAIGVFSAVAPMLLNGGPAMEDAFILIGFVLLGLSYGQAAGAVTANFATKYRYAGAALTADFAWLIGAAFAPLVALGLSAHFGLAYLSLYLLSGSVCTLAALRVNRSLEIKD